jgi:hypothetical protein
MAAVFQVTVLELRIWGSYTSSPAFAFPMQTFYDNISKNIVLGAEPGTVLITVAHFSVLSTSERCFSVYSSCGHDCKAVCLHNSPAVLLSTCPTWCILISTAAASPGSFLWQLDLQGLAAGSISCYSGMGFEKGTEKNQLFFYLLEI